MIVEPPSSRNLYIQARSFDIDMGRIKTDMVKRTTVKLVTAYPDKFSKSFENNKKAIAPLAEVRSKKLRNVIAGYAVRLKSREEQEALNIRRRRQVSERREEETESY